MPQSASLTHPTDLRRYLSQSIAATTFMMALPLAVVWFCTEVAFIQLPTFVVLSIALALGLVGAMLAARIWEQRFPDAELSFSELMLWSWYRLQKAERQLTLGQHVSRTAAPREEQLEVLHELTAALESKDPYTRGHSKRVERRVLVIGVAMGLPQKDVEVLRMAASLHDVGKIRIPNKILHKPGRLSDEERALIEEHPVLGSQMVAGTGDEQIVETVRHHHERWDGGGYPDGISGTEIPLFSRIIAVADSYDAITSTRSYRPGASRDEAVRILDAESNHQFDPDVVDAFMTTLPARRPMVAALMLVTGPGYVWRYLKHLFHRFANAVIAPVVGAVVTMMVLGAFSVLATGGTNPQPSSAAVMDVSPAPLAIAAPNAANASDAARRAARNKKVKQHRAHLRQIDRRRAAARAAVQRKRRRALAGLATTEGGGSRDRGSPTAGGSTAGSGSGYSATGTSGGGDGAGAVGSSTNTEGDLSSVDDPKAKGKDCKRGLGASSKGSRLHCN